MKVRIFRDQDALFHIVEKSEILSTQEGPGVGQTHIAVHDGADILIITDPLRSGGMIVYPCIKDGEAEASIHNDFRFLRRIRPRQ